MKSRTDPISFLLFVDPVFVAAPVLDIALGYHVAVVRLSVSIAAVAVHVVLVKGVLLIVGRGDIIVVDGILFYLGNLGGYELTTCYACLQRFSQLCMNNVPGF